MPRKKKKEEPIVDETIEIIKAWVKFKNDMNDFFSNICESSVELAFESSLDEHTHYHFDTDEAVFVNDIIFSPKRELRFIVPYGSRSKSFGLKECELINIQTDGETDSLDNFIAGIFDGAFGGTPVADIADLQKFVVYAKEPDSIEIFNHAEEHLASFELKKERSRKYSALPNYGIF